MNGLATRHRSGRLTCLWQAVAWLCCGLTLFPAGMPVGSVLGAPPAIPFEAEGEERPPASEDQDSETESGKAEANGLAARRSRQRPQGRVSAVPLAWQAHLPHHHAGTAGYRLPVCSPFASGGLRPMRC